MWLNVPTMYEHIYTVKLMERTSFAGIANFIHSEPTRDDESIYVRTAKIQIEGKLNGSEKFNLNYILWNWLNKYTFILRIL